MSLEQLATLSTPESLLFWIGAVTFIVGWAVYFAGHLPRKRKLPQNFENEFVTIDPEADFQVFLDDKGNKLSRHITYRNLIFPVPVDCRLMWNVIVDEGSFDFEIVPYVGFPPPLLGGTWKSPRFYSKTLSSTEFSKNAHK